MWAAATVGCGREPGPPDWLTGFFTPAAVGASSLGLTRPGLMFSLDPGSASSAGVAGFLPLRPHRIFTITRGLISPF